MRPRLRHVLNSLFFTGSDLEGLSCSRVSRNPRSGAGLFAFPIFFWALSILDDLPSAHRTSSRWNRNHLCFFFFSRRLFVRRRADNASRVFSLQLRHDSSLSALNHVDVPFILLIFGSLFAQGECRPPHLVPSPF